MLRSPKSHARILAALGDEVRLQLVARLCAGPMSITRLTAGSKVTRQAITKHLRVLEQAGIVHSVRAGRHSLFRFDPAPLHELEDYLRRVAEQWDEVLARLKSLVEG